MTSGSLDDVIVRCAGRGTPQGRPMGAIVDELVALGHDAELVERAVWKLLGERRLTPSGFVCRVIRRHDEAGQTVHMRAYEFLLIPWSTEMDQRLDSPTTGTS